MARVSEATYRWWVKQVEQELKSYARRKERDEEIEKRLERVMKAVRAMRVHTAIP